LSQSGSRKSDLYFCLFRLFCDFCPDPRDFLQNFAMLFCLS
jgi:hypothetical protein